MDVVASWNLLETLRHRTLRPTSVTASWLSRSRRPCAWVPGRTPKFPVVFPTKARSVGHAHRFHSSHMCTNFAAPTVFDLSVASKNLTNTAATPDSAKVLSSRTAFRRAQVASYSDAHSSRLSALAVDAVDIQWSGANGFHHERVSGGSMIFLIAIVLAHRQASLHCFPVMNPDETADEWSRKGQVPRL